MDKAPWSMMPRGVKEKIMASFCLMALLPLLVAVFMATTYIFPQAESLSDLLSQSMVLIVAVVISLLGFVLTKRVVDPVVNMALKVRSIASGDFEKSVEIESDDEVGDLAFSVNEMADRIKKNMNELNSYGERVQLINHEINKKVTALSSVLQITTLMSQSVPLDSIFDLMMDKVSQVTECTQSILFIENEDKSSFIPHIWRGTDVQSKTELKKEVFRELFVQMDRKRELVVWEPGRGKDRLAGAVLKELGLSNGVLVPIVFQGMLKALLVVGTDIPDYIFPTTDLEVIRIFQKQIVGAFENNFLIRRTKELSIRDEMTGLYNKQFISERLGEEIRRAILFQRPCSYVQLSVDHFEDYETHNSSVAMAALLKEIGKTIVKYMDDVSRVGRTDKGDFGIIMPEKNKGEALQLTELILKDIAQIKVPGVQLSQGEKIVLHAGISSNPIDGLTRDELINKAFVGLLQSKQGGQGRAVS